jgi:hypothetical protein
MHASQIATAGDLPGYPLRLKFHDLSPVIMGNQDPAARPGLPESLSNKTLAALTLRMEQMALAAFATKAFYSTHFLSFLQPESVFT